MRDLEAFDLDLPGRPRLRCLAAGSGPRLVLVLHGFPDVASSFAPILRRLAAAGYRAVAPGLRGYAPSEPAADGCYCVRALAEDVLACADALGRPALAIVGHDWGAITAYAAANLAPSRVTSLVTLAVPPLAAFVRGLARDPWQLARSRYIGLFQLPGIAERRVAARDFAYVEALWRRWSPGWEPPPERLQAVKEALAAPGALTAALSYYRELRPRPGHLASWRASRALLFRRLTAPALVLAGDRDGCIGPALFGDAAAGSDAPLSLRIVPGVGHFLHLEAADLVEAAIVDHLRATYPP
ncbi:MAG: alpha/beta fold hydrolase [Nannocystaceae bacterium]